MALSDFPHYLMDCHQYHRYRLEEAIQHWAKSGHSSRSLSHIPETIIRLDAVAALGDIPGFESYSKDSLSSQACQTTPSAPLDAMMPVLWAFARSTNRRDSCLLDKLNSLQNKPDDQSQEESQAENSKLLDNTTQTMKSSDVSSKNKDEIEIFLPDLFGRYTEQLYRHKTRDKGSSEDHAGKIETCIVTGQIDEEDTKNDDESDIVEIPTMAMCQEYINELQKTRQELNNLHRAFTIAQARAFRMQIASSADTTEEFRKGRYWSKNAKRKTESAINRTSKALRGARMKERWIAVDVSGLRVVM